MADLTTSANVDTLMQAADFAAFKTSLTLNLVENTALSTWAGSANITTLGTIATGTWHGAAIGDTYIASATTWNAKLGPTGAATITTLGTVGTGTWNATVISPTYGGTGVNNSTSTITLGGNLQTADSLNFTFVGAATLAIPNSGTLATLAGSEVLTNKTISFDDNTIQKVPFNVQFVCSDKTTDITSGTNKSVPFRMPEGMTVTEVRATVQTAPTGANIVIDINKNGSTILSTKISIEAGETNSLDASTQPVISDSSLGDDDLVTVDFDQVGSSVAGTGVVVTIIGTLA